jgi:UDP-glucuronate 4-epimerase
MNILITGCSGFIGFHLSEHLLKKGYKIFGVDNLNKYYSPILKKKRLSFLKKNKNFFFKQIDISNFHVINKLFNSNKFDIIFHLAAQPGVRNSILHPEQYLLSNIIGFFNIVECARQKKISRIIYASSSSVYGNAKKFPVTEDQIKIPESFYAFSKYNNEQLAELYTNVYKMNFIGLRFFTVFGEWGRPDMFIGKLITSCIKNNKFNLNFFGNHQRDFTYIKDVIFMIDKLWNKPFKKKHQIFNICSNRPFILKKIIFIFKKHFNKVKFRLTKHQTGDVYKTHGSNKLLEKTIGKINITSIEKSLSQTINWYKKNLDFIN